MPPARKPPPAYAPSKNSARSQINNCIRNIRRIPRFRSGRQLTNSLPLWRIARIEIVPGAIASRVIRRQGLAQTFGQITIRLRHRMGHKNPGPDQTIHRGGKNHNRPSKAQPRRGALRAKKKRSLQFVIHEASNSSVVEIRCPAKNSPPVFNSKSVAQLITRCKTKKKFSNLINSADRRIDDRPFRSAIRPSLRRPPSPIVVMHRHVRALFRQNRSATARPNSFPAPVTSALCHNFCSH